MNNLAATMMDNLGMGREERAFFVPFSAQEADGVLKADAANGRPYALQRALVCKIREIERAWEEAG